MRRASLWAGAALCLLAVVPMPNARAQELLDLRATFPRIEPYTARPSAPVSKEFSIAGPGTLEVTTTFAPWFRSTSSVMFRALVPIDGRDEGAWVEHIPGAESLGFTSTPERWVDGSGLTIVSRHRVSKARPKLEAGLFPSVVRYGDGSFLQLSNAVQVTVRWLPEAKGAGPVTAEANTASDITGRWADSEGPITITRRGAEVTGSYTFRDGRLTGAWHAPTATGYWLQNSSTRRCDVERLGTFYWGRYVLTLKGDRLEGHFGYCADTPNSPWSWSRIK